MRGDLQKDPTPTPTISTVRIKSLVLYYYVFDFPPPIETAMLDSRQIKSTHGQDVVSYHGKFIASRLVPLVCVHS